MSDAGSTLRQKIKNGTSSYHLRGNRIDGVRLSWPSRAWEVGASRTSPPVLLSRERFGARPHDRLVHGDSLDVARALAAEGLRAKVDLVYVDPPFASQAAYTQETRLDGPADGRVVRHHAYDDSWSKERGEDGIGAYLDMLAPRLEAMTDLLARTGTIWVHVDWRAAYLVRVLLDEILGRDAFLNEVVWRRAPNLGRQAASGQFGRTLDTLVVYGGPNARLRPPTRLEPIPASAVRHDDEGRPFTTAPRGDYTDASIERLEREGRVHRTKTGRVYVKYFLEKNADGDFCRERRIDTLWTDVPPLRHASAKERTGFPTQKPLALLDRVVRAATEEGGLVVDLFAGSGTTGEAAHALGRTFILGDAGAVAMNTARARLLRAGASFDVLSCGDVRVPDAGPVDVVAAKRDDGGWGVSLKKPTEPLAWAVGPMPAEGGPFRALWHTERRPGATPVPAEREAVLERGSDASLPLEARVYGDDGGMTQAQLAGTGASP